MAWMSDRDSITANVKKNINRLKAQAHTIKSTDEQAGNEGNEEEELSDDDDDETEEYPIQKTGWKCISSFPIDYIHEHISILSMWVKLLQLIARYQIVLYSVALSLGYTAFQSAGETEEANKWLLTLWELINQYNRVNLQYVYGM